MKNQVSTPESQAMTAARVRAIREAHGFTLKQAAEHIGIQLRSWQKWEQEEGVSARRPRGAAIKALEQMEREAMTRKAPAPKKASR